MTKKGNKQKAKASKKRKKRELELSKKGGKAGKELAAASLATPVGEFGLLRRIYKLARGIALKPEERVELVSAIEKLIRDSGTHLRPQAFGVKEWSEVAELLVKEMEQMNISPKTFRAFISNARLEGYRGRVRGLLFHLYVRNLAPLQDDLLKWALDQIEELNNPELLGKHKPGAKPPGKVNALGDPITTTLKFDKLPFRAEKIYIIRKDGKRVEYIDDAFISFSGTGAERYMSFLTETEVKTSAAEKGLGKQIASAQIRAGSKDTVSVVVVGRQAVMQDGRIVFEGPATEIKVDPKHIVYSPRSINRSGVTLFSAKKWAEFRERPGEVELDKIIQEDGGFDPASVYKASQQSIRSTKKGMGETYLLVRLAISTDEFNKVVRALLPTPLKK